MFPIPDIRAETIAETFVAGWTCRFGSPNILITDRSSQFTSATCRDVGTILNIKLQHTTAYHPQSNGSIERFHCQVKGAVKARQAAQHWTKHLLHVLLGTRSHREVTTMMCGHQLNSLMVKRSNYLVIFKSQSLLSVQ